MVSLFLMRLLDHFHHSRELDLSNPALCANIRCSPTAGDSTQKKSLLHGMLQCQLLEQSTHGRRP